MPIALEASSGLILLEDDVDVILLESEITPPPLLPPGNEFGFFFGMSGMMHRHGADD